MSLPLEADDRVAVVAMVLTYQRLGWPRRLAVWRASRITGRGASERTIWRWLKAMDLTIDAAAIRRAERRWNSKCGFAR